MSEPNELEQRREKLSREYLLGPCYVETCGQPAVEKLRLHRGPVGHPDPGAVEVFACFDHAEILRMLAL